MAGTAERTRNDGRAGIVAGGAVLVAAAVVAAIVAQVGLLVFGRIELPAFGNSNVLHTLTTLAQAVTIAVALLPAIAVAVPRIPRPVAAVLGWAGIAGLVTVTLGLPLAATRLYLHGVSVDQAFRTEFLTRMTDSPSLADMAYADLPSYYPSGWFWLGGRYAALTGLPGWEAFKPWSILSIAVAATVAAVLWQRLLGTLRGTLAAITSTLFVLAFGAPEPYGAVVALFMGVTCIIAWRAVARGGLRGIAAAALLLGVSATFYTLYTGVMAAAVVLAALVAALAARHDGVGSWPPLVRLVGIGVGSALVALVVWAPYLFEALRGTPAATGTASHYLPESGTRLPLPMFHVDLVGFLCLAGTIWLVVRALGADHPGRDAARGLGVAVLACYAWTLGSMAYTALGGTLLGFRIELPLTLLLLIAGVLGVVDAIGVVAERVRAGKPEWEGRLAARRVVALAVVLGALGTIAFAQRIPTVLDGDIRIAYSDTDGAGERADRMPAGAATHFAEIDRGIAERLDRPMRDIVVLTTEYPLLAFRPYRAFQAISSHYANPLGDYPARNAAITEWAGAADAADLLSRLDASPWRAPDVFVFRGDESTYRLRLSEDVYPNDPNVRRFEVAFPAALFDAPAFDVMRVGPFVVVTRIG